MKKPAKRWLVRITCLLLIIVFGAVLLLPPMPLIIAGYFRGEAFFDGRPTSYWRAVLQKNLHPSPPTRLENFLARFGYTRTSPERMLGPSRVEAVPVLLELLDDRDPRIRLFAAGMLKDHQAHVQAAADILTDLLLNQDSDVRGYAARELWWISPRAAENVSRLIGILGRVDVSEFELVCVLEALGTIGLEGALPALTPFLKHPSDSVRLCAAKAIWLIDLDNAEATRAFVNAIMAGGESRSIALAALEDYCPAGNGLLELLIQPGLGDEERLCLEQILKALYPSRYRQWHRIRR